MAFQAPVAFHDVVASFTVEQWMRMESWKKELYQNVVKEIHKTLLRLGYTIINPEVLFNIQKSDESCVRIDHSSAEREHKVIGDVPDLLLRVKEENVEEAHCSSEKPKIKDEKETSLLPKPSCPVISSVASLNVKEEQMVCEFGDATEPRQINNQDNNQLFIKQEEEVYLIDDYNTVGLETTVQDTPNPTATIKQEMDNRDHPFFPDIIPVVVKEECDPMEDVATGHHSTAHGQLPSKAVSPRSCRFYAVSPEMRNTSSGAREGAALCYSSLSREQRGQILLAQMQEALKPFQDEPCFPYNPQKSAKELEEEECKIPAERRRVGRNDWCACGLCIGMPTEEECVCCQEIANTKRHLVNDSDCVTRQERFRRFCLDEEIVYLIFRILGTCTSRPDKSYYYRQLRKTAYRSFTCWIHGFLKARNKRPIPACVVNSIRKRYPDPENITLAFGRLEDFAAVDMADNIN
uniref:KRAB domain-containing protein n=1 Tax=Leptobrachium leishanense TaxID=445787 RepID=A0A8C5MPD0_9ANUR